MQTIRYCAGPQATTVIVGESLDDPPPNQIFVPSLAFKCDWIVAGVFVVSTTSIWPLLPARLAVVSSANSRLVMFGHCSVPTAVPGRKRSCPVEPS